MKVTDFILTEDFSFEGEATVWGADGAFVSFELPDEVDDGEEKKFLSNHIDYINLKLEWIENNRQSIEQTLLDGNMLSLASKHISDLGEKNRSEKQKSYTIDGQKVTLPISSDEFFKAVNLGEITFEFYEKPYETVMYLTFTPDYFFGHCITTKISEDNQVECYLEG
jgi:hypothetical protein